MQREISSKKAKDLVYLFEIICHPYLGKDVVDGLGKLAIQYPDAYRVWRECLENVAGGVAIRQEMADQLTNASRAAFGGRPQVMLEITARFRRILSETGAH